MYFDVLTNHLLLNNFFETLRVSVKNPRESSLQSRFSHTRQNHSAHFRHLCLPTSLHKRNIVHLRGHINVRDLYRVNSTSCPSRILLAEGNYAVDIQMVSIK